MNTKQKKTTNVYKLTQELDDYVQHLSVSTGWSRTTVVNFLVATAAAVLRSDNPVEVVAATLKHLDSRKLLHQLHSRR